jgi:hypothetical protein
MNQPRVTVAIDGSVYKYHPHFHNLMMETISQLVNPGITVYSYLILNESILNVVHLLVRFDAIRRWEWSGSSISGGGRIPYSTIVEIYLKNIYSFSFQKIERRTLTEILRGCQFSFNNFFKWKL